MDGKLEEVQELLESLDPVVETLGVRSFLDDMLEDVGYSEPPPYLYHYTSAHGLHGIINSQRLHATNIRFMNDASELDYSRSVVRGVLGQLRRDKTLTAAQVHVVHLLQEVVDSMDTGKFSEQMVDIYAFCLSAEQDHVGQWREYAHKGRGYAMGFCGPKLRADTGLGQYLLQVEYNPENQQKVVESILRNGMRRAQEIEDERDNWNFDALLNHERFGPIVRKLDVDRIPSGINVFMTGIRLFVASLTFKHPAFASEREWRLVRVQVPAAEDVPIGFKVRENLIISFCEFMPALDGGRLPLEAVVMGPRAQSSIEGRALAQFLKTRGYSLDLNKSAVPLRF